MFTAWSSASKDILVILHSISRSVCSRNTDSSNMGDTPTPNVDLFREINEYEWSSDAEFQSGLQAILDPSASADEIRRVALEAQCFYFSRSASQSFFYKSAKVWTGCTE